MSRYIVRRLLIMIPTFFGISLVIFLVLNLAPGRPGAQNRGDTATELKTEGTQESYRIFREQFDLDKPALFNTRFLLKREDVEKAVLVVAAVQASTPAKRLEMQDQLEDWGAFATPLLLEIAEVANLSGQTLVRDTAVAYLRVSARQRLIDPFSRSPAPDTLVENRRIDRENAEIADMIAEPGASEADKQRVLASWRRWVEVRRDRYRYSFGDKLRVLFTETRFFTYWKNLLRLDFGVSLVTREPVLETLLGKIKYSLSLSVVSLLLAYVIAIPLGVFSAVRRDTTGDRVLTLGLFMLYSLPSFFVATVLLTLLSEGSNWESLRLFPTGGWQSADHQDLTVLGRVADVGWHLVLPVFCMTYGSLAAISRYMRSGLLEVIDSDYVRTARAKGLPEGQVIGKHALRNGLLPILTLLAGLLPAVLGGSVIIEYIFGIPGMGLWVV
jgi:ABC-type dipeptide/oligopeptide/nickel transport system permease component